MLKILKECPITFKGEDCLELLVSDDSVDASSCCDKCIYCNWDDFMDYSATCSEVHGCSSDSQCYFITKPLNEEKAV